MPGYDVNQANLLTGGAEQTISAISPNGQRAYDVPAGSIFSARDTLFTSGTLGRFCTMLNSVPEAAK